jgi:hypothetical protein
MTELCCRHGCRHGIAWGELCPICIDEVRNRVWAEAIAMSEDPTIRSEREKAARDIAREVKPTSHPSDLLAPAPDGGGRRCETMKRYSWGCEVCLICPCSNPNGV